MIIAFKKNQVLLSIWCHILSETFIYYTCFLMFASEEYISHFQSQKIYLVFVTIFYSTHGLIVA